MKLQICASLPAVSEDFGTCTRVLDTAAKLGIRGMEIKLGRDDLISPQMRKWLVECLPSYDFVVYTHLPYLQGRDNLASPDEVKASRAMRVIRESIEFSSHLGSGMVNTHLGVRSGKGPHIPRTASRLSRITTEYGDMEVSVENQESSCNGILNTPRDVETLLDSLPDVKLTYDAGHGNTHGFGVASFLPVVLSRLRYLHLHDNLGSRDEHLALGRGNLDIPLLLNRLVGSNPRHGTIPMTLELSAQDLAPSLSYLRKFAPKELQIQ